MRISLQILFSFSIITISACSYTQLHYENDYNINDIDTILNKNKVIPEYIEIKNTTDSAIISPTVRHYYNFKYNDLIGFNITPEGILLYLYNQGVIVLEAWYDSNENHGKTYYPPRFIAVIKEDSTDLWRSYFELNDNYAPSKPVSSKVRHFIFTGITKAAPNLRLKLTE